MTKRNVLKGALAVAGLCALMGTASAAPVVIISEILDGGMTGGLPKAVELTNVGDAPADLSTYSIAAGFNGGAFGTPTVLSGMLAAGDSFVIASEGTTAPTVFTVDLVNGAANMNGDDVFGLFDSTGTTLIDVYGVLGVDGTGQPWEFLDTYLERNASIVAPNATFTLAEWTLQPLNTTDSITTLGANQALFGDAVPGTGMGNHTFVAPPSCTADTVTVDSVVDGGDVSYHVATNSAAGIDTNVNCSFGASSCSTRIRGGDDDDYLYIFVDGSISFFNKVGILIDSDGNTGTGVVGDFPDGTNDPSNGIELFSEVAGGGWDTMLVIGRNGDGTGGDGSGSNQSFVDILTWTDGDAIEGEQFLGSGTAAGGSICATVRGESGTFNYAMNYNQTADNGIEIAVPRAWLSNSGIDCTGGYRLALINSNGGFNYHASSSIPQNSVGGDLGNTAPIMGMAGLTAPAFDYNSDGVASNTTPVVLANNGLVVNEGDTGVAIGMPELEVNDAEQAAGAVSFTLTAVPANGTLYNNAVALNVSDMFTQADVNGGLITYDHDGTETASDSFAANYTDGVICATLGTTFNITVTNTNDVPTVDGMADLAFTVAELGTYVLTTGDVNLADEEDGAAALTFEVSSLPANGTLNDTSRAVLMVGSTFTLQQLASGEISYTNTALGGGSDSFQLIYRDSTGPNQPAITVNATITASVNDWSILND